MVRNTSLPNKVLWNLFISNRWVKIVVEKFGKTTQQASWLLVEDPITTLCPEAPSESGWYSFFPPVLAPISRSCFFPFPPGSLGTLPVFGRKKLPTPGHHGCWGLQHRKPPAPKVGESGYWGKWSWWWRVRREIQQLLDLCEATFESALLGRLSDAHSLYLCDAKQMGRNRWALPP